jgi:hypothetical protein
MKSTGKANSGTIGQNHPWRLVHQVGYATARRDQGRAGPVASLAAGVGEAHPRTLTAAIGLVVVLADAGEHEGAHVQTLTRLGMKR